MANLTKGDIVFSRLEIEDRVAALARTISQDYRGHNPVLIGTLKGSFVFLADLVRHLDLAVKVDFARLSSYRGKISSGKISFLYKPRIYLRDQDVLVVEDIVDSGLTARSLIQFLEHEQPASLRLCALIDKPWYRERAVEIDYLGFTAPDKFLVGYGLDYNEEYRHLPDIYALPEKY